MTFKSIKEFESYILKKCENAISQTQEISRHDIIKQANAFYDSYEPSMYDRTRQLTDRNGEVEKFIIKSPINTFGSGCQADVHLEVGSLSYSTGLQPSGEQVVSAAVAGGHGAEGLKVVYSGGVSLWNPQLQEKANNDLAQALRNQGLPLI